MQRAIAAQAVHLCEVVTTSKHYMDHASNELQDFLNYLADAKELVGRALARPRANRQRGAAAMVEYLLLRYQKCSQEELEGDVHDAYFALIPCLNVIKEGESFY